MSFSLTLLTIGSLILSPPLYTKSKSPHGLPCHQYTIRGKPHVICWTIDDHPFRTTPMMLAVLKKYNVKATFFVVALMLRYDSIHSGRATRRYVKWLKAIKKAGHVIGNHSVTHKRLCHMKGSQVLWELTENQRLVKHYAGVAPTLFRPPHGTWCGKMARAVRRLKLTKVMYDTSDYKSTARAMWRVILWRIRHGKKHTIVLVHYKPKTLQKLLELVKLNP